jgi:hypothetical protein
MRLRICVLCLTCCVCCGLACVGLFHSSAIAADPTPRNWPDPTSAPERPGRGLTQHPMLYAGEGYNTIFLVNHGR